MYYSPHIFLLFSLLVLLLLESFIRASHFSMYMDSRLSTPLSTLKMQRNKVIYHVRQRFIVHHPASQLHTNGRPETGERIKQKKRKKSGRREIVLNAFGVYWFENWLCLKVHIRKLFTWWLIYFTECSVRQFAITPAPVSSGIPFLSPLAVRVCLSVFRFPFLFRHPELFVQTLALATTMFDGWRLAPRQIEMFFFDEFFDARRGIDLRYFIAFEIEAACN